MGLRNPVRLGERIWNRSLIIILIIIGIYIAPFPFIKCSKVLHIVIVRVIVNNASMGEPEKVCFETLLEGLTRCRILQVLWKRIPYGLYEDGLGGLQYTSKRSCFSGKLGFAIEVSRQWVMILRVRSSPIAQEKVFYFI